MTSHVSFHPAFVEGLVFACLAFVRNMTGLDTSTSMLIVTQLRSSSEAT